MKWKNIVLPIATTIKSLPRFSLRGFSASTDNSISQPQWFCCQVAFTSSEGVQRLGAELARFCQQGDVFLLRGDLGSGKTTLARGFIREMLGDSEMRVTSPSYLLDNCYRAEGPGSVEIHHIDLYRLPTDCDLSMLGIPDIFATSICLVEWPERMGSKFPDYFVEISLTSPGNRGDDEGRLVQLRSNSQRWRKFFERY